MAMEYINVKDPEAALTYVKTIVDETCEGSELQSLIKDIEDLNNDLDEFWVSRSATKSKEELAKSINNLKNLTLALNNDGAVAALDLKDIIDSQM